MDVTIITLPLSRWQENRDLRLRALTNDPTAFGSTYEEDAALTEDQWKQWLQDAQDGKLFLLFAEHDQTLVGMIGAILEKGTKKQHAATIIAMYVEPEFRGKGVGKKLVQALLQALSTKPKILVAHLYVNTQNISAIKLYESLGFKMTGTMEKAYYSHGIFSDLYIMTKMVH